MQQVYITAQLPTVLQVSTSTHRELLQAGPSRLSLFPSLAAHGLHRHSPGLEPAHLPPRLLRVPIQQDRGSHQASPGTTHLMRFQQLTRLRTSTKLVTVHLSIAPGSLFP